MNQELQQKLLEYLNTGDAFIKEQAPAFVNQAMAYYNWYSHFDFWFCIVVFIGTVIIASLMFFYALKEDSPGAGCIGIVASFVAVISLFGLSCAYANIKKLEMAPKLFLVDELTKGKCK